jgi:Tfp pilus assembly protein PilF
MSTLDRSNCLTRFLNVIFLCIFIIQSGCSSKLDNKTEIRLQLDSAVNAVNAGDLTKSMSILEGLILIAPDDFDVNHIFGAVSLKMDKSNESIIYLARAVELSRWKEAHVVANYIESLRRNKNLIDAWTVCVKGVNLHPNNTQVTFNAGVVARDMKDYTSSAQLMRRTVELDPLYYEAWDEGAEAMIASKDYKDADIFLLEAINVFQEDAHLYYIQGVCKHHQNKLNEALVSYERSLFMKPENYDLWVSMGALYQALGRSEESERFYMRCMPFKERDAAVRNNYGALLGTMGRKEEEIKWLKESLAIKPLEKTLINLGGYYQDEGLLEIAKEYFSKALILGDNITLKLRMILMLSPISTTWKAMIEQRNNVETSLLHLLNDPIQPIQQSLDSSLDRIHFYLVYHGLNDRPMQELIVKAYQRYLKNFNYVLPKLQLKGPSITKMQSELYPNVVQQQIIQQPTRRVRVGFMSKFFGIFEPHGMLLDGVIKQLPRSRFYVISLPIARTDGKPLSPSIVEASDMVVECPLSHELVYELVGSLNIDILVFADTMSEPMTHFLAHARLATIQASICIFHYLNVDSLSHAFGLSAFLCRIRFCDTLVVSFYK